MGYKYQTLERERVVLSNVAFLHILCFWTSNLGYRVWVKVRVTVALTVKTH